MSYQAQAQLADDIWFQARSRSAAVEQAEHFKDDQRPGFVALSNALLRGDGETTLAFTRLNAAGPGIADKVDLGDGTIDQARVTDPDLLSLTQANFPVIAELFFDADGNRIP